MDMSQIDITKKADGYYWSSWKAPTLFYGPFASVDEIVAEFVAAAKWGEI